MNRLRQPMLLLAITVVLAGCERKANTTVKTDAHDAPSDKPSSVDVKSGPDLVGGILEELLGKEDVSYHRFLHAAFHKVPPLCEGRTWAEVRASMLSQGFTTRGSPDCVVGDFLVKRKALQMPEGLWHDLWLEVRAETEEERDPTQPPKVVSVDTTLVAHFDRPAGEVLETYQLPNEFILGAMLRSDEVRTLAAPWPRLKQARVYYGDVASKWDYENYFGFFVLLHFATDTEEGVGSSMWRRFSIRSGLDPEESWDGKIKYTEGFVSRDVLIGEPRCWGGVGKDSPQKDRLAPDQ